MTLSYEEAKATLTRAQYTYVSWYVDILIYTVVLNLFVEYVEAIQIDSFTISLLTAILLKALLALIGGFDVVFGDRVDLGHFIEIVVLIISMIVARALADWIYKRLGTGEEAEQDV